VDQNAIDAHLAVKALTELHEAGGTGNLGWVLWETAREDWGPKELACQVQ
jgi:hypothetical protein